MRKSEALVAGMILVSLVVGAYLYPGMPEQMASHWNYAGQVDRYMPRFWAIFMMPLVSIVMLALFVVVPKIDPLKENIEKFRKYYDGFVVIITAFMLFIYALTLAWNLGFEFSMGPLVVSAVGVIFYYTGVLMENAKRNWFIGIRTPWTLSSDRVWDKTHKLAAKLFKAAGLLAFLGFIVPGYLLPLVIVPGILAALYLVVYSYIEYMKETK
jgi:uncharacterized membrane protein